jgi:hypothetical protein
VETFPYFVYFEANQLTVLFNPISMFLTEQLDQVQDYFLTTGMHIML